MVTLAMSIQMIAGIVVATPLSLLMGKIGRRAGFVIVALVCVVGGLLGAIAMHTANFWILFLAHFVLGCVLVGLNFVRFAVAEVVTESARANALSITLASGLIAALVGPSIFEHTQHRFMEAEYGGSYLAIAALGMLALVPLLLNRQLTKSTSHSQVAAHQTSATSVRAVFERPAVRIAVIVAVVSQALMVFMMVPTPLAMVDNGHMTQHASDVIRWHVIAMFAPGLFTGAIIGHFGVYKVISTGMLLLVLAGLAGLTGTSLGSFYWSLVLLGLGWNFSFIGATHLLQISINELEKSKIQGINDTLIAIVASLASVAAGVIYINAGWIAVSIAILALLTACTFAVIWIRRRTHGSP